MKKILTHLKKTGGLAVALLFAGRLFAQQTDPLIIKPQNAQQEFKKNYVKINLSSLALKNFNFNYERALTRKISFVAGYRFMPESKLGELPLAKKVSTRLGDEANGLQNDLNKITASNTAYTGEFRFYSGKHPGARGFYVSLYGRYTGMKFNYAYDYDTDNQTYNIPIKSDFKGFGGGVMFGAQWLIAKRVAFDWYIIGGHYGKLKGNANGRTDLSSMSPEEKNGLKDDLESKVVINNKAYISAAVDDADVNAKANGPFLGVRGLGFNLGIAF